MEGGLCGGVGGCGEVAEDDGRAFAAGLDAGVLDGGEGSDLFERGLGEGGVFGPGVGGEDDGPALGGGGGGGLFGGLPSRLSGGVGGGQDEGEEGGEEKD